MYYLLGHTSLLQSLCPSSDPMHSWPPFWALSNLVLCLDCWPPPHITEQPLQEFQSLHWQSTKCRINTLWYEKLKMIELVYFNWDRIWFSSAVREPGYLDNIYLDYIHLDFINLGRFHLHKYYPSCFYPGSLSQKRILVFFFELVSLDKINLDNI